LPGEVIATPPQTSPFYLVEALTDEVRQWIQASPYHSTLILFGVGVLGGLLLGSLLPQKIRRV
jgi:hypothetical protein